VRIHPQLQQVRAGSEWPAWPMACIVLLWIARARCLMHSGASQANICVVQSFKRTSAGLHLQIARLISRLANFEPVSPAPTKWH
jgi:hypothetical protein